MIARSFTSLVAITAYETEFDITGLAEALDGFVAVVTRDDPL